MLASLMTTSHRGSVGHNVDDAQPWIGLDRDVAKQQNRVSGDVGVQRLQHHPQPIVAVGGNGRHNKNTRT